MRKVYLKWLVMALVLITVLFNAGAVRTANAESKLNVIKERGYLIAGIKLDRPSGFKDEKGEIDGFDVDIIRYIADRLGVKLKIIPVTSSTRITLVADGVVDIAAATLTHTKTRDGVIDYSITYFFDGQKILVKKGSGIKSYRDLAGRKVGTAKGTTSERNLAAVQPAAVTVAFSHFLEAFHALQNELVDAVTTDSTILLGLKAETKYPGEYEIVGEFFSDEPYGLALPENDSKWRDFVNESLIKMWNSGEWLQAYNKWFGPGTKYEFPLDFKMSTWPLR